MMSQNVQQFGPVTLARARSAADLKRLLRDPWLEADRIIIKPNWAGTDLGVFTDSDTLRMLLEVLDSEIIIAEAYQINRTTVEKSGDIRFSVEGKERNWHWLLKGGWRWVQRNPSWDWFREKGLWDQIRTMDKWFLDEYGFTDLFNEFGVEYINVTEEVWQGRTIDPQQVKKTVEAKFSPVFTDKLYGCVPRKLFDLRGSTFVSFAKVKHYASFTLKNVFGLIPDPLRAWWHGPKNERFDQSINDVNKIYASLFNMYGICEALRYTAVSHPEGEFGEPRMKYNVAKDLGIVSFGRHLVSVDAALFSLLGLDPQKIEYLKLGEEAFGSFDRTIVETARISTGDWFAFRVPF